jgi:drug/metabolite transporter (DMT)-like permease
MAGAALLGFAPIGLRLSELGPQATAFWRFVFALPLLAVLTARAPKAQRDAGLGRSRMLIAAGVCFAFDIALWHAALTMTTVANATLLSNMTPILAAAAGALWFNERIARGFLIGAPIALAGAATLSLAREGAGLGEQGFAGDLTALFSAVWYAGYLILMNRVRRVADAWTATLIMTLAATVVAAVLALTLEDALLPQTLTGWAIVIGLGIVVHVGGQGLIAMGLGQLPIAISTVLLWVQPLAAAAFAWVLFDEPLGPMALAGAAALLVGIFIVQRSRS